MSVNSAQEPERSQSASIAMSVKKFPPATYPRFDDPFKDQVFYSPIYKDAIFEYRYMVLPDVFKRKLSACPDYHRTTIRELRNLGIIIPPGWQNIFLWRAPRRNIKSPTFFLRRTLNPRNDAFLNPEVRQRDPAGVASPTGSQPSHIEKPSESNSISGVREGLKSAFDALDYWSEMVKKPALVLPQTPSADSRRRSIPATVDMDIAVDYSES